MPWRYAKSPCLIIGTTSYIVAYIARGNVALSVLITAASTLSVENFFDPEIKKMKVKNATSHLLLPRNLGSPVSCFDINHKLFKGISKHPLRPDLYMSTIVFCTSPIYGYDGDDLLLIAETGDGSLATIRLQKSQDKDVML
ncbi:probable sodium/metabolite cotransporter BASS1, chloroplastic [Tanacetum coccineum]|uniref:Probable sodium/metabolite cotransporter BASS1, chloroplastic n=1 Tax=Tanacetum coccineum TaxID=301880 RepID=A0ABQ4ZIX4_9ASTR